MRSGSSDKQRIVLAVPFEVVFQRAEEGGYWVRVEGVPGCSSEGETKRDALRNIREALALHLEALKDMAARGGKPAVSKDALPNIVQMDGS
jgi:predicted RNase H-like HicB family nuclease